MINSKRKEDEAQSINENKIPLSNKYDNQDKLQQKKFNSKYIDNNGKWTHKAVSDGFVDFNDYIGDIKDITAKYPSFNNKNIKIKSVEEETLKNDNLLLNGYKIDKECLQNQNAAGTFSGVKDVFKGVLDKGKNAVNKAKKEVKETVDDVKNAVDNAKILADRGGECLWVWRNKGENVANKYIQYSQNSLKKATIKAAEWGLPTDAENLADAYRHFIWNAEMTRDNDVGYYTARDLTNYHEYNNMSDLVWRAKDSPDFDYLKDNTVIKCKMNQPMLMDLWNNQVGRELANNKAFSEMDIDNLFNMAYNNNWLITDASQAYNLLGITDYITDWDNYAVDTEWDLTTGNVKVKKDGKYVELKMGI